MTDTRLGSMVRLTGVTLSLRSEAGLVNILHGIDLSIPARQSVGLIGPSGSGKSSLMAVIAGLERPSSGTVEVAAARLNDLSEDALARFRRHHVGIVFQSFHLVPTMTAHENVAIPLELAGRRDAFAAAARELERVGLAPRLRHYPAQLSGGEQQRVALARALVIQPKLLLADEPTGNLDGETGRAVIDLMFALRAQVGATLVLITHDADLAGRCDRIVRLNDGRIVADSMHDPDPEPAGERP